MIRFVPKEHMAEELGINENLFLLSAISKGTDRNYKNEMDKACSTRVKHEQCM